MTAPLPDHLRKNAKRTPPGVPVENPMPKKRGASKDREPHIEDNRRKYKSLSNIPNHLIAETVDPNKPLTEKAKVFVKFWAQGESVSSAAIKAGYNDGATYAYKIARTPQAIALYNEEKRAYEAACQMTRKQVMDGFLEGIEMAKLLADPANVISGWREIAKMCGYYEPIRKKVEVNVNGQVMMQKIEAMSDEELLKILQQPVAEALEEVVEDDSDD